MDSQQSRSSQSKIQATQAEEQLGNIARQMFPDSEIVAKELDRQKQCISDLDQLLGSLKETQFGIAKLLHIKNTWHTEMKEIGDFELVTDLIYQNVQDITEKLILP